MCACGVRGRNTLITTRGFILSLNFSIRHISQIILVTSTRSIITLPVTISDFITISPTISLLFPRLPPTSTQTPVRWVGSRHGWGNLSHGEPRIIQGLAQVLISMGQLVVGLWGIRGYKLGSLIICSVVSIRNTIVMEAFDQVVSLQVVNANEFALLFSSG